MTGTQGKLSQRGNAAANLENPIWEVIRNQFDEDTNPGGYINLGIAENALMYPDMLDFVNQNFRLTKHGLTYGDGPAGSYHTRTVVARFFNQHFKPLHPVEMDHVLVTDGATTALEAVAYALAESGDAFLLGRPHYQQFPLDIGSRAGVKTVFVSFGEVDVFGLEAVRKYEEALLAAKEKGVTVRALILCSPHNPLGGCYTEEVLVEYMKLCQRHKIHLISDEIYALSVFHNQDIDRKGNFISVLSIDTTDIIDPDLVHVIWGLSKDFSANGLRAGILVSQSNPKFIEGVYANAIFHYPSSTTDALVATILSDDKFVKYFIETNQSRMSEHHKYAVDFLKKHHIPYYKNTVAAFFIWIDLLSPYARKLETSQTSSKSDLDGTMSALSLEEKQAIEMSKEITAKLMAQKVFCAAGESYGTEKPGWFRIIFTQPRPVLEEGLNRIAKALDLE